MARGHKPPPEDDYSDEFARAMRDVKQMAPDPRGRVRAKPSPPMQSAPAKAGPHRDLGPGAAANDLDDTSDTEFAVPGVDRRTLRQLKRGDIPPTNQLDLHGDTATDAAARASLFIAASRSRHRCVCIVHGRGLHSEGHVAILRTRIRAQLRFDPGVLAYCDAPPNDGGAGAVYVLLRR